MVELEMLAVVWALRKCRVYLLGMRTFRVVIDHKPLESIIDKKTLNEVDSPRLQRLKEKLLPYGNFTTTWRAGKKHLIADAFSRAPIQYPTIEDHAAENFMEESVAMIQSLHR